MRFNGMKYDDLFGLVTKLLDSKEIKLIIVGFPELYAAVGMVISAISMIFLTNR